MRQPAENFLGHDLADPKIRQIGVDITLPADQNIRRLHIAMNHSTVVGRLERAATWATISIRAESGTLSTPP